MLPKKSPVKMGLLLKWKSALSLSMKKQSQAYQASLSKMDGRVSQISVLEDTVKRLKGELSRKGMYRLAK